MFDAGVESLLSEVLVSIRSLVAGVEVDGLEAQDAARLVEECAEAERLLAALRVLATATLANKALWRREGFRSAAAWMASKTGTAVGTAIATMEMAGRLGDLPVVAAAFRAGLLSDEQARESPRWPPRCPTPRSSWWRPPGSSPCGACKRSAAGWRRRRPS